MTGHIQIPGQHHFVGFGVLYRRNDDVADAGVVVAAGGGNSAPSPAETDGAITRPQVTGDFHGLRNEVWQ